MDRVNRIREAYKRYRAAGEEWIEAILNLARELHDARQEHPSNQAFSIWLATNELDEVGHQDRAALLNIAEHADVFRAVMASCERRSPRLIWTEEVVPHLTNAGNTSPEATSPRDLSETPAEEPETPDSPVEMVAESVSTNPDRSKGGRRSPLADLPDGELVLTHVLDSHMRGTIAKHVKGKTGGPIWNLLVESIRSGLFGPPTGAVVKMPTLRMILPWAPQGYAGRFDLMKSTDRTLVIERVLPAVREYQDELLAAPDRLQSIVDATFAVRQKAKEIEAALVAMPATERRILAYGGVIWPLVNSRAYTYEDACEAAWFYDFVRRQATPPMIANQIRAIVRWIAPASSTGWKHAVLEISMHHERTPNGATDVPPPPINRGLA